MVEESKFNINFVREVFIIGDTERVESLRKVLKAYYFLMPKAVKELAVLSEDAHFIVAVADLSSAASMQTAARAFAETESPLAHRVVYATAPNDLTREQLLFAQEIGARYVCAGPGRSDLLKEYLKRVCTEAHQVGSVGAYEMELENAIKARDIPAAQRLIERIKALPAESEETLRMMAAASLFINDSKRSEAYLKRLLAVNPQNLWAANTLGKFYLRTGKALQGMEVLKKLSQFHELNSERLLTLGDAQTVAGKPAEAEATLTKTAALVGAEDPRIKEGFAKAKLAQQDMQGALAYLGAKTYSPDMISFLNMRAIMAVREQKYEEGIEYYSYALRGSGQSNEVKAKILFNMGLGLVRTGNLERAAECLRESCTLGGPRFQRAKGPLATVVNVIKSRDKVKKTGGEEEIKQMQEHESEWEALF